MEAGRAAACSCRVRTVPWHSAIRLGSSGPGAPGGVRRQCALNAAIADAARDVAGRVRGVIGALGVEERYTYMEPEPGPERLNLSMDMDLDLALAQLSPVLDPA